MKLIEFQQEFVDHKFNASLKKESKHIGDLR